MITQKTQSTGHYYVGNREKERIRKKPIPSAKLPSITINSKKIPLKVNIQENIGLKN